MPMKRLFARLAVFCLLGLLVGCGAGTAEEEPAWQTTRGDGSTLSLSGCTVREEPVQFRYHAGQEALPRQILHITGKTAPVLTVTGVEESAIALLFVEPAGDGSWVNYEPHIPEEKLDYVLTRGEDGALHYRLDTVYGYAVAIGPELWVLDITREGL